MRWRPLTWFLLSVMFFVAAYFFWEKGNEWAAKKKGDRRQEVGGRREEKKAATNDEATKAAVSEPVLTHTSSINPPGNLNSPPAHPNTNHQSRATSPLAHQLRNTTAPLKELARRPHAILLENALLDTDKGSSLALPEMLKAEGDPGSYIAQAKGTLDKSYRAMLKAAGASIVSYIPNNAYLVRASEAVAQQIGADPLTQTVVAYQPYYKLKPSLLDLAVDQRPLPEQAELNVLLFSDARAATLPELQKLGAEILGEEPTPFGPMVKVRPPSDSLPALAKLPGVQIVELARARVPANDLSRAAIGVALDSTTNINYLGLTGSNVLVNVNDTGVDATHPDLTDPAPKVLSDTNFSLVDTNGHGTHVAGIIAGTGLESTNVTFAQGSVLPTKPGQFRGKAPGAKLFSVWYTNSDFYLQQTAAATNALISNNGWTYAVNEYDIAAASYDAAVRDSLPMTNGSQPVLYVFAAGNAGDLNVFENGAPDGGTGGASDSIQSPGTAKNVITVGASEQLRMITNVVCTDLTDSNSCTPIWQAKTDSSDQVAGFSSRGNVGIGFEGQFGRYKPDVVAPGTFVISTRSSQWDQGAYYNPTNVSFQDASGLVVNSHQAFFSGLFVPDNAVQLSIRVLTNRTLPPLPIYVTSPSSTVTIGTNQVSLPPDGALTPLGDFWTYSISNPTLSTVTFDLEVKLVTTNDNGNFFQVLSNLNNSIEGTANGTNSSSHFYRYESGTSMAAASVSGMLALMQEFFQQRAQITNSPAMMKALLINGARSLGDAYNFQVKNNINYQGWGLVNLPNSLPAALAANLSNHVSQSATAPMFMFDQSPTNALATGESHTRIFKLNNAAAQNVPLRFTLVWTDPPGNPAASIKLVNDLDLIVTNLDTTNVFYGNDIGAGNDFNFAWDTNTVPNVDVVNNVENVYLNSPLGSNYSVTVVARHVNVNAVTAHTNDVVQDYALVVSSGDGQITNALSLVDTRDVFVTQPFVTLITNSFPAVTNPPPDNGTANQISGGFALHQHVGADTPLRGTNLVGITGDANAVLTVGMTNQWHFYVISNDNGFTNAAFVTFLPPELSVVRMGVTNADNPDNASRPEADIDLYVSTDPNLTNLSPVVLTNSFKSLGRGGTELVVLSNAQKVAYYIGVKSEDQVAAEYDFIGIFSQLPFGSTDTNGDTILRGIPVPAVIPPGTPPTPQAALVLALDVTPMELRRVVVTNWMTFDLPGNLLGNLSHNTKFAVLNNHTCVTTNTGECITNTFPYVYEDNGEGNVPGSRKSDGPGSLKDFIGEQAIGLWLFTMVNNFPSGSGEIDEFTIKLEKSNLDSSGSSTRTIPPNSWTLDSINVPAEATNLTVCVSGNTAPVELYVRYGAVPDTNSFDYHLTINPPGDCLSISIFDVPPLKAGRYYIGVYNPNQTAQTIRLFATVTVNPFSIESVISSSGGPTPIQDDSVTYSYLTNLSHLTISSLDVGVLLQDPRVSDLSLTLIAPDGTRVLLFQNRGAWSTNGLGTFSVSTNGLGEPVFASTNMAPFYTNDFERSLVGWYAPGAVVFEGWNVLTNFVSVVPDWLVPWQSNNALLLMDGVASNSLPTTNSTQYSLSFKVTHAPYLVGTIGWWPFDRDSAFRGLITNTPPLATDIFGGHDGILFGNPHAALGEVHEAFQGDGVYTRMKVPASPDLDVGQARGFSIEGWIKPSSGLAVSNTTVMSDGFENAPQVRANTPAGSTISGWLVESGEVALFYAGNGFTGPPDSPDTGTNALSLNGFVAGSVSRSFPTTPGSAYTLSFAYTKDGSPQAAGYPFHVSSAQIDITGQPTIPFSYGASNNYDHMNWAHTSMVFTATSPSTKLKFTSTIQGQYGIILDSVKVSLSNAATNGIPLVEWYDPTNVVGTNVIPSQQGVQFWLSGLPGVSVPGALYANIWDTNFQPHIISTPGNIITNDGWQHVALTYDARSMFAQLYTNGHLAISQQISSTNFVPRTGGDLYFGYHNSTNIVYTACFNGGLDEFALYNRPLSDCEVLGIYSATNRGKYGTNVLLCPVTNSVELFPGNTVFTFTNGFGWITNGLTWETNTINFNNPLLAPSNGLPGTNLAGIIVSNLDPNVAVDAFVLSGLMTNTLDGLLHFTDDTNLAFVPIKFAPSPYLLTNFPPMLIFSNDFENATAMVYQAGSVIRGGSNNVTYGRRDWTVVKGPVTVVTNTPLDAQGSNLLALARGAVETELPTTPGHKYQVTYSIHGPAAVGWWNGDASPLDGQRARDLIGGNDGAFVWGATNVTPGFVGQTALFFVGEQEPVTDPDNPPFGDDDDPVSKIELGDPDNLKLTNSFTIEGWFMPTPPTNPPFSSGETVEQIFFRGDSRHCLDPYFFGIEQVTPSTFDVIFHIENENARDCGIILETSDQPVQVNQWQHLAAVFETQVLLTNIPPVNGTNSYTNQLRLYLNGTLLTNVFLEDPSNSGSNFLSSFTWRSPFRDLDPAYSPGVTIGNRSRLDASEPYIGFMDEVSVYARALSDPEIAAIAAARQNGKFDRSVPAPLSLAKARVLIDDVEKDTGYGDNSAWATRSFEFTALRTNSVLHIESLLPGTLIDNVTLTEIPTELTYQPEQSLSALTGKDGFGVWKLEILDSRVGATNGNPLLVDWKLTFQLVPSNAPPTIYLSHGVPYTNTLTPSGVQTFVVEVPQWASYATNVVLSATRFGTTNPSTVGVLFDRTNHFPTEVTNFVFWPPVFSGTNALTTNSLPGSPSINIGQPYYLTVTNTNTTAVTFAIEVLFDIIPLTNCQPLSNFVWEAGIPRYFQFDVPSNAVPPGSPPANSSFWLYGAQSNITVVLSQHLPLPDLTHYDYISAKPATNNEIVMTLTNSTPFAIDSNRWYVGVFGYTASNSIYTNIPFVVEQCYVTNNPTVIVLTNDTPYLAYGTNPFVAPPGPPRTFFFEFDATNNPNAILFELYNLTGNADLLLQQGIEPTMTPYFDTSFNPGTVPEQIVVRPRFEVPTLTGRWFLGVYNNEGTNYVGYTIRAVIQNNSGLLVSALPIQTFIAPLAAPHGVLLQWNGVIGENYLVQYTPTLNSPITWTTIGAVVASTTTPTFEVPRGMTGFFRVIQSATIPPIQPTLTVQLWTNNTVRISWPVLFPGYTLQYSQGFSGVWIDVNQPVNIELPDFVVYDPIGSGFKFYRLIP